MTNSAESTRTLVLERDFPHSPEKLWRALTQSSLLAQWLMDNNFDAQLGHKFQFRHDPVPGWNGIIDCEVLAIDPLKQLSYTWTSMGMGTVVLFTLTPTAGGTQLRMEQSGFSLDQDQNFKGAKYGWQGFFNNLEGVLKEAH